MDVEQVPVDGVQAKLDYGDRLKWIIREQIQMDGKRGRGP